MENRYQRHNLIPGWQQDKLSQARVIIVGIGAVGNEVLRLCALAGIKSFLICDPDQVSTSNLSRCSLFKPEDVGTPKVIAAQQNLLEFVPDLRIDARLEAFLPVTGLGDIKAADIVISCVDSVNDRMDIAARCNLVQTPYIDGGTQPWGGEVRLFFDIEKACYACEQIHNDVQGDNNWSCGIQEVAFTIGASILMTAQVASFMSTFAIRHLMGLPHDNHILRIDGATGRTEEVILKRSADCLLHYPIIGEIKKIPISREDTLAALLSHLSPNARPLLWVEQLQTYQCYVCGTAIRPAQVDEELLSCPKCEARLFPVMDTDLRNFNTGLSLKELGIPDREILAVNTDEEILYLEMIGSFKK